MRSAVKFGYAFCLALAIGMPAGARPDVTCLMGPFILYFDHGSSDLDTRSRSILDEAVKLYGECGPARTQIDGYTDTSEPRSLSRKRAIAARAYLAKAGLPTGDIMIRGSGSDRLRVPTPPNTPEGRNRRVVITYGPPSE